MTDQQLHSIEYRNHTAWSLLTLLRFYADNFVRVMQVITSLHEVLDNDTAPSILTGPIVDSALRYCDLATAQLVHLRLDVSMRTLFRLIHELRSEAPDRDRTVQLLLQFSNVVCDELEGRYFLSLSPSEAEQYEKEAGIFGDDVDSNLPVILTDLSEATKCLALGRYTASVFHLMRVMERGVRECATQLGVSTIYPSGKSLAWGDFETPIIAEVNKIPSTDPRRAHYNALVGYFKAARVAWRNETMHPKATYTLEEAEAVFGAVRSFMRELVKTPSSS